jgi:hypothetical protein
MSHPLPTHPPSTPPLGEGDIVYKFICPVNERKLKADFQVLRHMKDVEVLDLHYGGGETIAYDTITNKLVLLDTTYIGFIVGDRRRGSQHPDLTPEFMIGYDIRWECNGNYLMTHFEDEQSIISLERLEPMTPEDIKNYLLYGQKRLASK